MAATSAAFVVIFFNGMGSVRAQGLRYANQVDTLKNGELFYQGYEEGDKFFTSVWPAEDFDDVVVEDVGSGIVHGEPRRASSWRRWIGVKDPKGFLYRLILHKWFPPCSRSQIDKGLRDVRDALAQQDLPLVIYGNSRGAGLVFLVVNELEEHERARIKLVVAEAPFDNVWNVVLDRLSERHPWLSEFLRPLATLLPWPNAPLSVDFPHDVPLIMGSGTEDESCMLSGQLRLAEKLEAHPDFEHVIVDGANHNNIWLAPAFVRKVRGRLSEIGRKKRD